MRFSGFRSRLRSAIGYVKRFISSAYKFFRDDFSKLVVATLLLVIIGIFLYSHLTSPSILIEPFQAPEDLAHQGLTGHVIAQKLLDEINLMKAKTRTSTFPRGVMVPGSIEPKIVPSWPAQDIEVTIQGTSINSLSRYIALALGRDLRISGEIFRAGNIWNATVRISSDPRPIIVSSTELLDLLRKLATSILRLIKPLVLADYYYATNNAPATMEVIGNVIRTSASKTDQALAYNFWGLLLSKENKYEEAIAKYRRAVELDPEAAYVHINWGNTLHNWGNTLREDRQRSETYEQAGLQFDKASKINPRLAAIYFNWGNLLRDQKKYSEAERTLRVAFADPGFKSHAANSLALVLEAQNKIPEALEVYEEAIRTTPGLAIPYVNLAQLLGRQERYKEGYAKLEEAAGIDPQAFEVHWAWGVMLASQKEYKQAIAKLERAVSLHPRFDELHLEWGRILYALEDYDGAAAHFRQAADIKPTSSETYLMWGEALKTLGAFDEAVAKFERGKELNPARANEIDNDMKGTYLVWGRHLREKRKYPEAIAKFKKSTEIDPKFAIGFFEWGLTLTKIRKFAVAATQFQKAFEVSPHLTEALANWGIALLELKRYGEAVTRFRSVIEKEPNYDQAIHYLLGEAYFGLHEKGEAKEAFVRYLNKEPKGIYAPRARKFLQDMNVTGVVFPPFNKTTLLEKRGE